MRRLLFVAAVFMAACSSDPGPSDSGLSDLGLTDVGADAGPGPDTGPPPETWELVGPVVTDPLVAPSAPYFREVSQPAGFVGPIGDSRAMIVDFDGDGRDDIVTLPVTAQPLSPRFFRATTSTNGPGFEEVTESTGMAAEEAIIMVFGDVDNDGDQDIFTGAGFRAPGATAAIWMNDGAGRFSAVVDSGINPAFLSRLNGQDWYNEQSAAAFGDFDRDGNLDLYVGHWFVSSEGGNSVPGADELYQGDGTGHFTEVTLPDQHNPLTSRLDATYDGVPRAAYGIATSDFDGDGDLDIFVNNYGVGRPSLGSPPRYWDHNFLWRNDGDMTFTDVGMQAQVAATFRGTEAEMENPLFLGGQRYPAPIGGNGFGCQFSDFDNDGDQDLAIGTIAHPDYTQSDRTMLHVNQGDGTFSEESAARGLQYSEDELHPAFVDVDNDGRLDFAMSRLRGGTKWELYLQNLEKNFEMQTYEASGVDVSRPGASLWVDYDQDGDLDFFLPKGNGRLFENTVGQDNHWLEVRLVATAPADATGALVSIDTTTGLQSREISSGNGHYNSQLVRGAYFGLGGDSGALNLRVRWPDGSEQTIGNVKANQVLRIEQGQAPVIVR